MHIVQCKQYKNFLPKHLVIHNIVLTAKFIKIG